MSAVDTAHQVLEWALADRAEAPPVGDLADGAALAALPAHLRAAMGRFAAVTAAQLRLDECAGRLGPELALLAAAVGVRDDVDLAMQLLDAVPVARSPIDCIAYHGIARHMLAPRAEGSTMDAELLGLVRSRSTLTALLDHPGAGDRMWCLSLLDRMLGLGPDWRALLTLTFAAPPVDAKQATWRRSVLDGLRFDEPELVMDVYETALRMHGKRHLELIRQADRDLRSIVNLEAALAIALLWSPLVALERSMPAALRARKHLGLEYLEALRVARFAQRLTGAAA